MPTLVELIAFGNILNVETEQKNAERPKLSLY